MFTKYIPETSFCFSLILKQNTQLYHSLRQTYFSASFGFSKNKLSKENKESFDLSMLKTGLYHKSKKYRKSSLHFMYKDTEKYFWICKL